MGDWIARRQAYIREGESISNIRLRRYSEMRRFWKYLMAQDVSKAQQRARTDRRPCTQENQRIASTYAPPSTLLRIQLARCGTRVRRRVAVSTSGGSSVIAVKTDLASAANGFVPNAAC